MANYPLSETTQQEMKTKARELMTRRVAMMAQDFPLTSDEVVEAVVPEHMRVTFNWLKTQGVDSLQITQSFYTVVDFEYPVLLRIFTGRHDWFVFDDQRITPYSYLNETARAGQTNYPRTPFDTTVLTPAKLEKLQAWVARVAQERRLEKLTNSVITDFLDNHCPTLYHLMVRWPDLKFILTKLGKDWPNRIDAAPKAYNLSRWDWSIADEEWVEKYSDAIALITQVLVSGEFLTGKPSPSPVTAVVQGWKKNETWTFP